MSEREPVNKNYGQRETFKSAPMDQILFVHPTHGSSLHLFSLSIDSFSINCWPLLQNNVLTRLIEMPSQFRFHWFFNSGILESCTKPAMLWRDAILTNISFRVSIRNLYIQYYFNICKIIVFSFFIRYKLHTPITIEILLTLNTIW